MPEVNSSKYFVTAGFDDVPHIDEKTKREIEENTPPHLRGARMRGEPSLGAGAIYPIDPKDVRCDPFVIPEWWRRGYGFDPGWNRTAAVWGAHDPDNDILYLIGEHYRGQVEPSVHADAIKARGAWQPGFADYAGRSIEGERVIERYQRLGLKLVNADKSVEAGILEVYQRLSSGRMKVFATLSNWFDEYRIYHRDEKGKIVKLNDHCLHPDTMVLTDQGAVAIRDLVGTEGRVLSLDGEYQPYRNCRRTAINQEIIEVLFDDGSVVRCTPDHRFLTVGGWVEAVDLPGLECYKVSSSIGEGNPWSSRSYHQPSKSTKASATTFAAGISSATVAVCMWLSGVTRMGGSRPRATTSTTKTRIARTISRAISICSSRASTCLTTGRVTVERLSALLLARLQNGTPPTPAANGTASITPAWPISFTGKLSSPANSVARSSSHRSRAPIDSAPTAVRRNTVSCRASTTLSAPASSAARLSRSIDTGRRRHAAPSAKARCLGTRAAGRSDVYCMTVPSTAAFAVANGIVVHNCMDATRYLAMGIPQMIVRPNPQAVFAPRFEALDGRAGY